MDAEVFGLPNIDSLFFDVKVRKAQRIGPIWRALKLYEDGTGLSLPPEIYRWEKPPTWDASTVAPGFCDLRHPHVRRGGGVHRLAPGFGTRL